MPEVPVLGDRPTEEWVKVASSRDVSNRGEHYYWNTKNDEVSWNPPAEGIKVLTEEEYQARYERPAYAGEP